MEKEEKFVERTCPFRRRLQTTNLKEVEKDLAFV